MPKLNINKIKKLCETKNISKRAIADKMGIEQSSVSQWFTGKTTPNSEHLKELSDIFETTEEELVINENKDGINVNSPNNTIHVYHQIFNINMIIPPNDKESIVKIIKELLSSVDLPSKNKNSDNT